jgi:hypothetical protein
LICGISVGPGATASWTEPDHGWDAGTEAIGDLLIGSASPENEPSADVLQAKRELKRWIAALPQQRRVALRTAAEAYAKAFIERMREMVSDVAAGRLRDAPGPSVEAFVRKFKEERGLMVAWTRNQALWPPMKAEYERTLRRTSLGEQERARRLQESQRVVNAAGTRMEMTLEELFGKKSAEK